ncbi:MAG: MFS transporter, partial [Candidatus Eremiobacteraeota bacterium]|nr:MFS transporter [Candidatus Eremiobacteraeota bacterium]
LNLVVIGVFNQNLDQRLAALKAPPTVVASIDAQRMKLAAATPPANISPTLRERLQHEITEAYVAGFRWAMLIGAGLALVSSLVAALWIEPLHRVKTA